MRNFIRTGIAAIALYAGIMAGCATQKPVQPEQYLVAPAYTKPVSSAKKPEISETGLDLLHVTMLLKYIEPSQKQARACLENLDNIEQDVQEFLESQE